ncbi:MAG: linear amide C-N hydrolase [Bdellovibrionales bacterium]|nr:linear amide C-N hydrolase [Bdellovibrionales bacterium]
MSFIVIVFTVLSHVFACSSFLIPSQGIMAKNYDWDISDGYIMTNAKSTQKTSMVVRNSDSPHQWTSKYSSITFNQYGREFPNGGINEKGLAVEILWLNTTVYPARDTRETINELQWIQYQLDNYASIEEVIENIDNVRVSKVYANVHYFVCDANLNCATVEYIAGKPDIHYGNNLPYPSITNSTYRASSEFITDFEGFGGSLPVPNSYRSLDRFVRATSLAQKVLASDNNSIGFSILDSLQDVGRTQWQILYDLKNKSVQFRTKFSNRSPATFKFSDINQSCDSDAYYFDLKSNTRGDNLKWNVLTKSKNEALVRSSFGQLYGNQVPAQLLAAVSNHPYSYSCK